MHVYNKVFPNICTYLKDLIPSIKEEVNNTPAKVGITSYRLARDTCMHDIR